MEPAIQAEVARLLAEAGITQYQLVKAGISTSTARKLVGADPGALSVESADRALALIGRRLWHQRAPKS